MNDLNDQDVKQDQPDEAEEAKQQDPEKVALPSNVIDLVNEIVDDIGQARDALNDVQGGQLAKALGAVFSLIEGILVKHVLPLLTPKT